MKARFTDEQIITMIKEQEACDRHIYAFVAPLRDKAGAASSGSYKGFGIPASRECDDNQAVRQTRYLTY